MKFLELKTTVRCAIMSILCFIKQISSYFPREKVMEEA